MRTLWLPLLALAPLPALAHPGHAAARDMGLLHWLVEPDHLAVLALCVAVPAVAAARRALARRAGRR